MVKINSWFKLQTGWQQDLKIWDCNPVWTLMFHRHFPKEQVGKHNVNLVKFVSKLGRSDDPHIPLIQWKENCFWSGQLGLKVSEIKNLA